jgi:NAD(P)-dependent dehydrogenase (short-subunit alcohol dehydrogenase family)/acyl carrier protein
VPRRPGTVLVTGGTGLLGGLVGEQVAASGRAARVVLASRSGPAVAGAARTAARVAGAGADVQVLACDAADRAALAGLLEKIPADRPLTGVVHAAGILDDGVIGSLTPERVDAVMRPKADAAWNLHELTAQADLGTFAVYSSAAATFGSPGQGNYAAANGFLDGLASYRQASGLPAVSLAWGLWEQASGMTGHLDAGEKSRMARGGVGALSAADGMALLTAALDRDEALLVPARLDLPGTRTRAQRGEEIPALWRELAPAPGGPARLGAAVTTRPGETDPAAALRHQLAGLSTADRDRALTDLVRSHAAAVLGHAEPDALAAGQPFKDLGFDSLTALELRNRLNTVTGLRLPATLIFDCPTPAAMAGYLRAEFLPDDVGTSKPVAAELDQLESALSGVAEDSELHADITQRLQTILSKWLEAHGEAESEEEEITFGSATEDEVFSFLDKEHGEL